ncbi:hypothetical protein BKA67DRAFT_6707 [Truncatella angustata]|uniref:C2H2-type domain-containing protein n=1 Tax=Truncatella angustata TaxID=152316 RepID=A0A9P8UVT2_9PEZI|nr:uncharacterized protein BKA67DRAFT_6707 [Truncatella angustata]KAH6659137.1 hypothetical protein BKA67DRAFT_6707 [Truncatella angustata]
MFHAVASHHLSRSFGLTQNISSYENHCLQLHLRSISARFVTAASVRNFRASAPRYTITIQGATTNQSKPKFSTNSKCPAGTKNESVTQSTIIRVVPARSTSANQIPLFSDSLAMNSKIVGTSRGGSHQSTSQGFIDAYLARKKREEIDKLMEMLVEWLDSPAVTSHAPGPGNLSGPAASSQNSSTSSTPEKSTGQKRSLRRDSFNGSNPGRDGNGDDKRGNKRSKVENSPALKLACPYFKRDPTKYAGRQACTGPGYDSISRLKEHIYRSHKQPDNKCNRCCEVFSTGEFLEEHQRDELPCKVSQDRSMDGINESQYHQLRKKPVGRKPNPDRWEEVYRIIFPKAKAIPSCYYGYDDANRVPECRDKDRAFTDFIENELIAGVRNDLEDQFDKFAEETRTTFIDIVKIRFKKIQEQFYSQRPVVETLPAPNTAQQALPLLVDPAYPELDFDLLSPAGFYFDEMAENLINDFGSSSDLSDSAYCSMDSPRSPLQT